jgi:hypothetical protein
MKVSGECEVEAKDYDEAVVKALEYFAEDTQNNLDVTEGICEEQEAKADLHGKYDVVGEAEAQENFSN